jgi:hypothetical protein
MPNWISPAGAMAMVYDDPAGYATDFGFALLRRPHKVLDLARAKLQPREPTIKEVKAAALPITASAHRLVLAPLVHEPKSIEDFFAGYDEAVLARQKLLAVVLTMRFEPDSMVHDVLSAVSSYAELILAQQRRVSSLVVVHRPGEAGSPRAVHAHILAPVLTHRPGGYCEVNACFQGDTAKLHTAFLEEWRTFRSAWDRGRGA